MKLCPTTIRSHSDRRGVLLLSVLVCIVVATVILVSLANRSLRLGAEAAFAQRRLQQKWGGETLEEAVLGSARDVFSTRRGRQTVPNTLTHSMLLGGVRFSVLLADESAKANLNLMAAESGAGVNSVVSRLTPGAARPFVMLAPSAVPNLGAPDAFESFDEFDSFGDDFGADFDDSFDDEFEESFDDESVRTPRLFRSWGQVFDLSRMHASGISTALLPGLTGQITCWGINELNIARAPEAVIVEVCSVYMPPASARRLVREYQRRRAPDIFQLIDNNVNDADTRSLLKRTLVERSSCFSIWVLSSDGRHSTQRFSVLEYDEDDVARTSSFEF